MTDVLQEVRCFDCDAGVDRSRVIFVRRQNLARRWGPVVMCDDCHAGYAPGREPYCFDMDAVAEVFDVEVGEDGDVCIKCGPDGSLFA